MTLFTLKEKTIRVEDFRSVITVNDEDIEITIAEALGDGTVGIDRADLEGLTNQTLGILRTVCNEILVRRKFARSEYPTDYTSAHVMTLIEEVGEYIKSNALEYPPEYKETT